jgi:hypothetical protein
MSSAAHTYIPHLVPAPPLLERLAYCLCHEAQDILCCINLEEHQTPQKMDKLKCSRKRADAPQVSTNLWRDAKVSFKQPFITNLSSSILMVKKLHSKVVKHHRICHDRSMKRGSMRNWAEWGLELQQSGCLVSAEVTHLLDLQGALRIPLAIQLAWKPAKWERAVVSLLALVNQENPIVEARSSWEYSKIVVSRMAIFQSVPLHLSWFPFEIQKRQEDKERIVRKQGRAQLLESGIASSYNQRKHAFQKNISLPMWLLTVRVFALVYSVSRKIQ